MHNVNATATLPPTNPPPRDWLSAKEAGECLLGSLSAAEPADSLYIFSMPQSVEKYQHGPEFGVVRQYIPLHVATEYAGDIDSVYALLEDVFENDDEEMRFGTGPGIPEAVRDEITMQLQTWSAQVFSKELAPQAQALGYTFHRDMMGGFLMSGSRLMCIGPPASPPHK